MTKETVWPQFKRSLVAILRGIKPGEVAPILDALIVEGFECIEIPLNSPSPWVSIENAAKRYGNDAIIGAGTVLSVADVERLASVGGRIAVSPNTDTDVISASVRHELLSMPGCFTPTEALLALRSGASALKFFPAGTLGPSGISTIKAVLPASSVIGAVGGVSADSFADYARIGIRTFGLGTSLYRPGDNAQDIRRKARQTIEVYDAVFSRLN